LNRNTDNKIAQRFYKTRPSRPHLKRKNSNIYAFHQKELALRNGVVGIYKAKNLQLPISLQLQGAGREAVVCLPRTPCNTADAVKAVIPQGEKF
jgi:uncharacterized protein (UPF0216 family)